MDDSKVIRLWPQLQAETNADIAAIEQDLTEALGMRVGLTAKGGEGRTVMTIDCEDLEQLDELCRRLMRGQ